MTAPIRMDSSHRQVSDGRRGSVTAVTPAGGSPRLASRQRPGVVGPPASVQPTQNTRAALVPPSIISGCCRSRRCDTAHAPPTSWPELHLVLAARHSTARHGTHHAGITALGIGGACSPVRLTRNCIVMLGPVYCHLPLQVVLLHGSERNCRDPIDAKGGGATKAGVGQAPRTAHTHGSEHHGTPPGGRGVAQAAAADDMLNAWQPAWKRGSTLARTRGSKSWPSNPAMRFSRPSVCRVSSASCPGRHARKAARGGLVGTAISSKTARPSCTCLQARWCLFPASKRARAAGQATDEACCRRLQRRAHRGSAMHRRGHGPPAVHGATQSRHTKIVGDLWVIPVQHEMRPAQVWHGPGLSVGGWRRAVGWQQHAGSQVCTSDREHACLIASAVAPERPLRRRLQKRDGVALWRPPCDRHNVETGGRRYRC